MTSHRHGGLALRPSRPTDASAAGPTPAPTPTTQNPTSHTQPQPQPVAVPQPASAALHKKNKHSRSSYTDGSPLVSRNNSLTFRPPKRQMPSPDKTIAIINASGRQAASLIRVATAVGYRVRAQLRNLEGVVATEVSTNPLVTVLVGELYTRTRPQAQPQPGRRDGDGDGDGDGGRRLAAHRTGGSVGSSDSGASDRDDLTRSGPISGLGVNHSLIQDLFRGAQLAFVNTTFYGDEFDIGKALVDAAVAARIEHFIYSSMPDHAAYGEAWPSLPLWAAKHQVEAYVRRSGLPATFVYTGIYNNNFTSLPYPLFCMELQPDGGFLWQAPFHPDAPLPWLDAEHDVGPAVLQILKDGVAKWSGRRIALAYEMLSPREACRVFSRGVGRPVTYVRGPIELKVKIPAGYRRQLESLEKLFGLGGDDASAQPPYFGDAALERSCPAQAMALWEGPRLLEEYAREVFPLEEHANGLTWMLEDDEEEEHVVVQQNGANGYDDGEDNDDDEDDDDDDDDEGLVMRAARKRDEEEWLA